MSPCGHWMDGMVITTDFERRDALGDMAATLAIIG